METLQEQAVNIDEQRKATGQSGTVSQRKLNANRENAKKSTGPRTARGKAYSRKNAIKHGLFTGLFMEFVVQGESQEDYDRLLDGLHKQFEPIGKAEELEVELMAVRWWRLHRAWRYENSQNQSSVFRELGDMEQREKSRKRADEEREAIILGLQNMIAELSVARDVPPDLKDRCFVLTSTRDQDWSLFEDIAKDKLKDLVAAGRFSTVESIRKGLAELTLNAAIACYKLQRKAAPNNMKIAVSQHVIPNGDALERILRYETAVERSLDRALNRLERLQRSRKGEPALPPVNVRRAVGSLVPTKPRPATEANEVAQDDEKVEVKEDPDRQGYIEMS